MTASPSATRSRAPSPRSDAPETLEEGATPDEEEAEDPTAEVRRLLQEASESFAAADAALREGDFSGFERHIQAAREAIQEALGESAPPELPDDVEETNGSEGSDEADEAATTPAPGG